MAEFHASFARLISELGGTPDFHGQPNEVPNPVPFDEDHRDRPYDRDAIMRAISQEEAAPGLLYFASVVHQRMYCLMCGADPDTFEGGNPDIAYHVIRNSQNIAKHYWAADKEPYPAKQ